MAEYLPSESIGTRLQDVLTSRQIPKEDITEITGMSISTLNRILKDETKLSADDASRIARYLGVSTDFLLCLTDEPYPVYRDLELLGLTPESADKMYSKRIDTDILNLLINDDVFAAMLKEIALYRSGFYSVGVAAQNIVLNEARKLLIPEASAEIEIYIDRTPEAKSAADIHKYLDVCLSHIKKDNKPETEKAKNLTRDIMKRIIREQQKNNIAMLRINSEKIAESIVSTVSGYDGVTEEMKTNLLNALLPFFKTPIRKKK